MNKNILVFPCGSEIGLEINNALKYEKDITLFGASSVNDHGRMIYKNHIKLPYFKDDKFENELNNTIKKYNIDFIFPAHDDLVLEFSKMAKKLDAQVITSEYATCDICRSKKKTYTFFKNKDFVPHMYNTIEEVKEYPVFLKPDIGQGSKRLCNC